MALNGIDVSSWQPANIGDLVPYDFVIAKATEGTNYVNPHCDPVIQSALKRGKCWGTYHFATVGAASAQASYYLKNISGYIGKGIMALDFEAEALSQGSSWVYDFCRQIIDKTGIPPLIYCSASPMASLGLTGLAKELGVGLWVAAYPNSIPQGYSQPNPPIEGAAIYQYASTGRLDGYGGNLDLNVFYGDAKTWAAYVAGDKKDEVPPALAPPVDDASILERIAQEVIDGKWGNGENRKTLLAEAGYDYNAIQNRVNALLGYTPKKSNEQIADEVIAGKWGNGNERMSQLAAAGYDYRTIQELVNKALGVNGSAEVYTVKPGDTLSGIAAKYGVTYQAIAKLNGISNPSLIYPGQRIRLP